MANHRNTTVNETSQARTCAALMDAFDDADDAYAAAVERGDIDRGALRFFIDLPSKSSLPP